MRGRSLEDWSTEELRSLHDDLHERYGPPAAATATGTSKCYLGQVSQGPIGRWLGVDKQRLPTSYLCLYL